MSLNAADLGHAAGWANSLSVCTKHSSVTISMLYIHGLLPFLLSSSSCPSVFGLSLRQALWPLKLKALSPDGCKNWWKSPLSLSIPIAIGIHLLCVGSPALVCLLLFSINHSSVPRDGGCSSYDLFLSQATSLSFLPSLTGPHLWL